MRWLVALVASVLPAAASAQDVRPAPARVSATVERGLGFLVKDALAWKAKHNCASCHHAALVVWSMREAKQSGHTVDEPVLAELTRWLAESGNGKFGMARPASAPQAASPKAVYFALALGTDPKPDAVARKGMRLLLTTVESEQTEKGSWVTWPETRPRRKSPGWYCIGFHGDRPKAEDSRTRTTTRTIRVVLGSHFRAVGSARCADRESRNGGTASLPAGLYTEIYFGDRTKIRIKRRTLVRLVRYFSPSTSHFYLNSTCS